MASGSDQETETIFFEEAEYIMKEVCGFSSLQRSCPIMGGITNKACLYETDRGKFFVKYALRENAKEMFESEVESLRLLRQTQIFRVPEPVKVLEVKGKGALVIMEFMENMEKINSKWSELGTKLARLHSHNRGLVSGEQYTGQSVHYKPDERAVHKFGFSLPVFYGPCFSSPAVWCETWEEFYIRYQLKPQFDQLQEKGDRDFIELWSHLNRHLHKYKANVTVPSLTHGDFCAINIGEADDTIVMYDPCSVYAPPETDFTIPAMMPGNMKPEFYKSYHNVISKSPYHDMQMSAQLAFAYPLVYNIPGQEETTKKETLNKCKVFLNKLELL